MGIDKTRQVASRIFTDPDYSWVAMNPELCEEIAVLLKNWADVYGTRIGTEVSAAQPATDEASAGSVPR